MVVGAGAEPVAEIPPSAEEPTRDDVARLVLPFARLVGEAGDLAEPSGADDLAPEPVGFTIPVGHSRLVCTVSVVECASRRIFIGRP